MNILNNIKFRLITPLVYGIINYLLVLLIFDNLNDLVENEIDQELIFTLLISYFVFEVLRIINYFFNKKINEFNNYAVTIVFQIVISLLLTNLIVFLFIHFYFIYIIGFSQYTSELYVFGILFSISALLYNLLYFSFYYQKQEQELQTNHTLELSKNAKLKLAALKDESDAYLFFESMKASISYLQSKYEKADEIAEKLSKNYRYKLSNKHNERINLNQELETAKNLLKLLQIISHNNIKYTIENLSSKSNFIINGLLIKIINLIYKYSIISIDNKLDINIEIFDNSISIKSSKCPNFDVCFKEIINQLNRRNEYLLKSKIEYFENNCCINIHIPIINEKFELS